MGRHYCLRETLEVAFEGSRVSVMPLVARGIVSLPGVTGFDGLGVAYMMPEPVHDIVGGTIGYLIALVVCRRARRTFGRLRISCARALGISVISAGR